MGGLTVKCGNCNAWLRDDNTAKQGTCRARPPVPMFFGMQQHRSVLKGLPGNGMARAEPVIMAVFPTMAEHGWCREWEPAPALEKELQDARDAQAEGQAAAKAAPEAQA